MKLTLIPAQYLEQSIHYPELSLCRIVSQEKGLYRIISAEGDQLASVSGKFQHEAASPSDYPVVGDYVMAALTGGAAVINRVLPRKAYFSVNRQAQPGWSRPLPLILIPYSSACR